MKTSTLVASDGQINCSKCLTRNFCLTQDMSGLELNEFNRIVQSRRKIKKGEKIITAGMPFDHIFTIRSGFFKTVVNSDNGQSHLLGFQMAGDALGMDGIAANIHLTEATAIEDSNVCAIPFMSVEKLSRTSPKFQRKFLQFMSLEIGKENKSLIIFSQMPAEERVATFIQNLIWRLKTRGFSSSEIIMRMTRVEIGQFLGLTIETISRTFAKFSKLGILAVDKKKIRILNKSALAEFARVPEC